MEWFFGVCMGIIIGALMAIALYNTSSLWFKKDEVIVRKSNSGLVCYKDENYPQLNCSLIKEAIGPKKNPFEFKVEEK